MRKRVLISILSSVCARFFLLLLGFIQIKVLIAGLDLTEYGLWVTITSIPLWLLVFDFGIGNFLKNSVAADKISDTQEALDVGVFLYVTISVVSLFIVIIFTSFNDFGIANRSLLFSIYIPVTMLLPMRLFSFILQGKGKVPLLSWIESIRMFGMVSCFYLVIAIDQLSTTRIIAFGVVFSIFFNLPPLIYYSLSRPIMQLNGLSVRLRSIKPLLQTESFSISSRFFILQLSSLALFSMGNVLTFGHFGGEITAQFDILNKLYVAGISLFNMGIAVLWPEFTKGFSENNFEYCRKLYRMVIYGWIVFTAGVLIVSYFIDYYIFFIVDSEKPTETDLLLVYSLALQTIVQAFAYSGAVILNSLNKLQLQVKLSWLSIVAMPLLFLVMVNWINSPSAYPISVSVCLLITGVSVNFSSLKELKFV